MQDRGFHMQPQAEGSRDGVDAGSSHNDPGRLIDVRRSSHMYGVSWRTFLRWADQGLVPWGIKLGGRRLWQLEELDRHIRGGCKPVRHGRRA